MERPVGLYRLFARRYAQELDSAVFGSAIGGYLEQLATDQRSAAHISRCKSYLEKSFRALHTIALASIDRATVARELNLMSKRGPVAANRARAVLSAFFNWSIANGLCENNPVDKTTKNKEYDRERVLVPRELRAVWLALKDDDYSRIAKLLTLTVQRRDEIARLERLIIVTWSADTDEMYNIFASQSHV